ncbi:hypothetical protein IU485_24970 [Nocardia cyriacigeorgica]|uniref:hypothetical protein n=1 Tax=Nocardia cyriacigeorgica TaxID=135487 RepID=UPI001895ED72|nr:hypothetical protein [Nocardia cyriacigeorgica]MBF6084629.1 hypothetical protein [Nocardia cyriacigeorgica]MBF6428213.1 hypothetical protein [Nocardia cyriacigeorgica]
MRVIRCTGAIGARISKSSLGRFGARLSRVSQVAGQLGLRCAFSWSGAFRRPGLRATAGRLLRNCLADAEVLAVLERIFGAGLRNIVTSTTLAGVTPGIGAVLRFIAGEGALRRSVVLSTETTAAVALIPRVVAPAVSTLGLARTSAFVLTSTEPTAAPAA